MIKYDRSFVVENIIFDSQKGLRRAKKREILAKISCGNRNIVLIKFCMVPMR